MNYYILDKTNIKMYLAKIEKVDNYFGNDELFIDEIGDGNLNFVYIIRSKQDNKKALILKQAVPYLRCVGEEFPLNRERMTYEIRSLQNFHKNTPSHIPEIYDANEDMSTLVMQFLADHIIMRKGMISKIIYPNFSEHISTYLAENLFKNSSLYLDSASKRKLISKYNTNTELCKLTEDFVFTFAFMEHETNDTYAKDHEYAKKLFEDMEFKKAVLFLKYKFMNQTDTLLHGDLHTGSIMLNQNDTYVIDSEFSFVGPIGFDLGALIGNLVTSYTSHVSLSSDIKYRDWVLKVIVEILEKFQTKFLDLWNKVEDSALMIPGFINDEELQEYKQEFMLNILRDAVGFAGCKMSRRMFGIAGVEEIRDIKEIDIKDNAIKLTLDISTQFVKKYQKIDNIEDIINIIKGENR